MMVSLENVVSMSKESIHILNVVGEIVTFKKRFNPNPVHHLRLAKAEFDQQ